MNNAERQPRPYKVRIAAGGRLVIPAEVRTGLGLKDGDEVLLTREGQGIRLTTLGQAVRDLQALFAPLKTPGVERVAEFLGERRQEAAEEGRER